MLLWTTFTSEQVDIDVHHPEGRRYLADVLDRFQAAGVRAVRLDAVGYAVKKAGTSCFMIPETFDFIAEHHGASPRPRDRGPGRDPWALPGADRDCRVASTGSTISRCRRWCCTRCTGVTRRACCAGWRSGRTTPSPCWTRTTASGCWTWGPTGERRAPGLLPPADIDALVETIHERSRGESRQATGGAANNLDLYQVNCTFYDALGRRDAEYLVARAIQCFVPGSRRSTTSGCSPAATTWTCCAAPASGATSTATTTRRTNCSRRSSGRSCRRSWPCCGSATPTPRFRALPAWPRRPPTGWRWSGGTARQFARLEVDLAEMRAVVTCSASEPAPRRHGMAVAAGGAGMTQAPVRRRAQRGLRQDADLSDVRHVRDDDRLGRPHHSRDRQDLSAVADGGGHVPVRDDDRHRARGPPARPARRPVRPAARRSSPV